MAVGFSERREKVSVVGKAEPEPELPITAVPEDAPEAAVVEDMPVAVDAVPAADEDVAWRARSATAS